MKKILTLILLFVTGYLIFVYARFYFVVGMKDLQAPTLTRYVINEKSSTGSVKYLALGDSLSAGVGASNYQRTFIYLQAKELAKKNGRVTVVNLGLPGATTKDLIKSQIPQVAIEKPDYITLLIGTNDVHNRVSEKQFSSNFKVILDSIMSNSSAQITVINIPYLGSSQAILPPYDSILNYQTKKFNDIIATLVSEHNLKLVDLYRGTLDDSHKNPDYYSPDLFHPGDVGHQLWSQLLINAN